MYRVQNFCTGYKNIFLYRVSPHPLKDDMLPRIFMNDVKSLRFGAAFDTTGTGVYVPSKQWMERTENRWCNRKGVYQPSHMYFILEDEAGSLYPALYPWRHNTSDSFARFAYKKYSKKRLNFFKCILSVHRCQRRRNSTVVFWKFQLQIDLSHSFH